MNDQPIGYEPTPRAARAIAAVWVIAGLCVLAARRIHAHRRRIATALAFAATAFAGWHARGVGPATVGATRVEAAAPTPTADPLLQPGHYSAPGDDAAVLPPMLQYAAPGGPDDGTAPTWLPGGLAPWWPDIVAAAHEHGLDSHAWGAIVAIECPWGDPSCGSPVGARGLAQIMAGTAGDIADKSGLPCTTQPFDGPTSLRCGAFHFAELVRMNGDLWTEGDDLATLLAAAVSYNSGAGAQPRQAVRAAAQTGGDLCAGVAFKETMSYCRQYRDLWQATVASRGGVGPRIGGQEAMVRP